MASASGRVRQIAHTARQVITESRRLLQSASLSSLGSFSSRREAEEPEEPAEAEPEPAEPCRSPVKPAGTEPVAGWSSQGVSMLDDEQMALQLEQRFEESMRKHRQAVRKAEELYSQVLAEQEEVTRSFAVAKLKEEANAFKQEASKADALSRQRAAEQRDLKLKLQGAVDLAKADLAALAQQRAESEKQKRAAVRGKQKRLRGVKQSCAEMREQLESLEHQSQDSERGMQAAQQAFNHARHSAMEVSALAKALKNRVPEVETSCDTGGSGGGAGEQQLAAAQERCLELKQELALAVEAEMEPVEVPAQLTAELAELKEEHQELLKSRDSERLQELAALLEVRVEKPPRQPDVFEEQHLQELCEVEMRISGLELDHLETCEAVRAERRAARVAEGGDLPSEPSTALREARLCRRGWQLLGKLDLTELPAVMGNLRRRLAAAQAFLEERRQVGLQSPRKTVLQTEQLELQQEALEQRLRGLERCAACAGELRRRRREDFFRGASLRTRLEVALKAESAMGAELAVGLEEESRQATAWAAAKLRAEAKEAQECRRIAAELADAEVTEWSRRRMGLQDVGDELDARHRLLRRGMACAAEALEYQGDTIAQLQEEVEDCKKIRAWMEVASEAESAALHAALCSLNVEKAADNGDGDISQHA
ncbi:unnamed protein product [Effrenium voratum]|uniref:Uncharacterized protein n=1 Tax=Effrenium voratum TaxID=2562239 RepID=A0AA36I5R3_9DINO|nr:unnamed protein product [Effrenium voratum]CAJ1425990.1 unnamed protein product [Effrenium voratum]